MSGEIVIDLMPRTSAEQDRQVRLLHSLKLGYITNPGQSLSVLLQQRIDTIKAYVLPKREESNGVMEAARNWAQAHAAVVEVNQNKRTTYRTLNEALDARDLATEELLNILFAEKDQG